MRVRHFLLALFILGLGSTIASAETPDDGAEHAIRQAVDTYVTAWRAGDAEKLRTVFELDHGYVIWAQGDDGNPPINSMRFADLVGTGSKRRENPDYGLPYEIISIDIINGELATAKFAAQRTRGYYINLFSLITSKNIWKIVTKSYSWHGGGTLKSAE